MSDLHEAARELLTVARLRGDNVLPHPAVDTKGWTARMQTAWNELERALNAKPEVLRCHHDRLDEDGICRSCGADCRRGGI